MPRGPCRVVRPPSVPPTPPAANICSGLGSASSNVHRDIYKSAKNALSDRSMAVREAAATCLQALADVAPFMYTSTSIGGSSGGDLENLLQVCFRSLDGTNSEARKAIAKLIGLLVAYSQKVCSSTIAWIAWISSDIRSYYECPPLANPRLLYILPQNISHLAHFQ